MAEKKDTMFIVEDEEVWAATLTGKLGKKYNISVYGTGEEAVEKMAELRPKYIIQDFHLDGEMTGLDTVKEAKKILGDDVYIVMFSAQDDVQTAIDTLDSGAYDYVVKGESGFNRLKIILRNIEKNEELRSEVVHLRVKVTRERVWIGVVVFVIFIVSMAVYVQTCPEYRLLKWDPLNMDQTDECQRSAKARGGQR